MAIPIAHRAAVKFMPMPSPISPDSSMPLPSTCMPAIRPAIVTTVATTSHRRNAPTTYPAMIPLRRGAPSISLRAKPDSKSRATAKPVKTPPNAADCRNTNANWNEV